MSIFGAKPNAAYIVILYDLDPPTSSEQDEILSKISEKVKLPAKIIGTSKFLEENRASQKIFDAYIKAVCAMKLAFGTDFFKGDYKTIVDTFGSFTVATMTGQAL